MSRLSTDQSLVLEYYIRRNVPFDGTYYYNSQLQSSKEELEYIKRSGIWEVSELWVNDLLLAAFTASVDVRLASTLKLSGGFYGEPYPGGGYQELRLIGTHKIAMLFAPNM